MTIVKSCLQTDPEQGKNPVQETSGRKILFTEKGRTYFSRKTERTFYFVLTLIMLAWWILARLGVFTGT